MSRSTTAVRCLTAWQTKWRLLRYHSLIGTDLPDTLKIVSTDSIGEVMAVMDEKNKVFGLQFHPESILTPQGSVLLKNFLAL